MGKQAHTPIPTPRLGTSQTHLAFLQQEVRTVVDVLVAREGRPVGHLHVPLGHDERHGGLAPVAGFSIKQQQQQPTTTTRLAADSKRATSPEISRGLHRMIGVQWLRLVGVSGHSIEPETKLAATRIKKNVTRPLYTQSHQPRPNLDHASGSHSCWSPQKQECNLINIVES